MDSIQKNAEIEIDQKTKSYMQQRRVDYRTALAAVAKEFPDLNARYQFGGDAVVEKKYNADSLPPARREMNALVADSARTQFLAGSVVDHLAKQRILNVGPGVADSADAYRRAVVDVQKENPNLAEAARTGYIAAGDFALLALLMPSVAKEISLGNYSRHDSNRCSCGKNLARCRGEKLARQRRIHEDNVAAYAACILEAQKYGSELDKLICLY